MPKKRMTIVFPAELAEMIEQDAKQHAISQNAVIRLRLSQHYDQMAAGKVYVIPVREDVEASAEAKQCPR